MSEERPVHPPRTSSRRPPPAGWELPHCLHFFGELVAGGAEGWMFSPRSVSDIAWRRVRLTRATTSMPSLDDAPGTPGSPAHLGDADYQGIRRFV